LHAGPFSQIVIPKVDIQSALDYPVDTAAGNITLASLPKQMYDTLDKCSTCLLSLFAKHKWALAPNLKQGVTWIEMLILFFLQGGSLQILGLGTVDLAESRCSMRKVFLVFKAKAKATLAKYVMPEAMVYFKPSKFPALRGKAVGFSNHIPNLAGLPALSKEQAGVVAQLLVATRHTFNANSLKAFEEGTLKLRTKKISYRGAIPESWSALKHRKIFPQNLDEVPMHLSKACEPVVQVNSMTLDLVCPQCDRTREAVKCKLLDGTRWKSVWCNQCKQSKAASKWKCLCSVPWYVCSTHAYIGHALSQRPASPKHKIAFNAQGQATRKWARHDHAHRSTNKLGGPSPSLMARLLDGPSPAAAVKRDGQDLAHHNNYTDAKRSRVGVHPEHAAAVSRPRGGQKRKQNASHARRDDLAAFERLRLLRQERMFRSAEAAVKNNRRD
jgi:hypothetical protein